MDSEEQPHEQALDAQVPREEAQREGSQREAVQREAALNAPGQLLNRARSWASTDVDPQTSAQLQALIEQAQKTDGSAEQQQALAELTDAFAAQLEFGTAGLRAPLGPGPNRMNRMVVRRAAAGLADFLQERVPAPKAVIGFDARHNSAEFARDTAAVFAQRGVEAWLMPRALPTPVLAWAVRGLNADAGVMVTASHNPAQDNGYKVYLGARALTTNSEENVGQSQPAGSGAQIVPPFDAAIASHIYAEANAGAIELADSGWHTLDAQVAQNYTDDVVALAQPEHFASRDLSIVHTALHGVGAKIALDVLRGAGFETLSEVAEQAEPDPDFPTVQFPNPEEPGALDLAIQHALSVGADIVLANDPDADRLAVAIPDKTGSWRMLRGDEVGSLLGAHVLARAQNQGVAPQNLTFANSLVSSRQLGAMASRVGAEHEQTLTGFKWIARVPGLSYGYEEALGYCVAPELVRDKDGISAALLVAELAAAAKTNGKSLEDLLDEIAVQDGLYLSGALALRVEDQERIAQMMAKISSHPPTSLAGSPVVEVADLESGYHGLPGTVGLLLRTESGIQVIVRPSGTEPKLKCYIDVVAQVQDPDDLHSLQSAAKEQVNRVMVELQRALEEDGQHE